MKKILFSIICLFSCFIVGNVGAAEVCTDDKISAARATLSVTTYASGIPIPTLGRSSNNIYVMTLTMPNGEEFTALCLDSGLPARTGLVYKINQLSNGNFHEVNTNDWKKVYQYAMENRNNDIRFVIAQAAMWLLRTRITDNPIPYSYENIYGITKDVMMNRNCESYLGMYMSGDDAKNNCATARQKPNPTSAIELLIEMEVNKLANKGGYVNLMEDPRNQINSEISKEVTNFINYQNVYDGTLYYWVESNGGSYQAMLAPLNCEPESVDKYCVDENGNKKYYTEEYKNCIVNGGTASSCKSSLDRKYCPGTTNKYGTVKTTGQSAVCVNKDLKNEGTYKEYVDFNEQGNASEHGSPISQITISPYCNLYCLENSAVQVFPGNIGTARSVGTYVIWPTSDATQSSIFGNKYPLKFTGQKECYVEMSPNSINESDIDGILAEAIKIANNANGTDSTYAKKTYEVSRTSGGCEVVYNDTNGACASYSTALATAKTNLETADKNLLDAQTALNNIKESESYKKAVERKKEVDSHNSDVATCESKITETKQACNDTYSNCVKGGNVKSCYSAREDCYKDAENCGSEESLSETEKKELASYDAAATTVTEKQKARDDANTAKTTAENAYVGCNNSRVACKKYETAVNNVIELSNQIRKCVTYIPQCSGEKCDIYNYSTSVDVSWNDPEYGTTITEGTLEKVQVYSSTIEGDYAIESVDSTKHFSNEIVKKVNQILTQVKNTVAVRKIIANVNVTYSLPTKTLLNNYIVTQSNGNILIQNNKPIGDVNFISIGYSNLPISLNATPGTKYELKISNISFGDNGQYKPSDYVCNYNIKSTPTPPPTCKLEDGTVIDITECIDSSDYEACYKQKCPNGPEEYTCTNPCTGATIDITNCINDNDYSTCYKKYCEDTCINDNYTCKNTITNKEVDITSCVMEEVSKGSTVDKAKSDCTAKIPDCNTEIHGVKIIYRTISLENPFPSYDADKTVTQSNLYKGKFNDDIKGRYPGQNWNNQLLVKNHIRTARGYSGSSIYQGEPLYTFVLTTSTINMIRTYNKQQLGNGGYSDFTLDCKNNSSACVSSFIHKTSLSGLTGGVCAHSVNANNFYVCSGD